MFIMIIFVICTVIYAMFKKYETRAVLFGAGLVLACLSGNPMQAFELFTESLKQWKVMEPIVSAMGFVMVVKYTECDLQLVALCERGVKHLGFFLIPGVALITLLINSSITSATGVTAAVGSILIPVLISEGIRPPIAAAAVLSGTYGASLNPGQMNPTLLADIAGKTSMDVIAVLAPLAITATIVSGMVLAVISYYENKNRKINPISPKKIKTERISIFKAFIPILPLILLLLGHSGLVPYLRMQVSHAMLIGVIVIIVATRKSPGEVSTVFFDGFGKEFGNTFGLLITANIFVGGLQSVGVIDSLIQAMTSSKYIAKFAAGFGPFLMALLSGSGDAAIISFNTAVSGHASQFGLDIIQMGSMVILSGTIGRSVSPLSGPTILCSNFAKVSPLEVAKYCAPGLIIALIACFLILMF